MNNKELNNQQMHDNWNHDKYIDANDKNFNQGKNNKIRKTYSRYNNEIPENQSLIPVQNVNTKTLVADFIDQPKKQQVKKIV